MDNLTIFWIRISFLSSIYFIFYLFTFLCWLQIFSLPGEIGRIIWEKAALLFEKHIYQHFGYYARAGSRIILEEWAKSMKRCIPLHNNTQCSLPEAEISRICAYEETPTSPWRLKDKCFGDKIRKGTLFRKSRLWERGQRQANLLNEMATDYITMTGLQF